MFKVCLPILLLSAAAAQKPPEAPEPAPPEVESALRARVSQFFQAELNGKFREAEQLVSEEYKDTYVASNKPRYTSFEIDRINYSDHFTKAVVILKVGRLVPIPGFFGQPVPGKIPSRWKMEKDLWCWYTEPSDTPASPFGMPTGVTMSAPPGMGPPQGQSNLPPMPNMAAVAATAIKADKSAVEIKAGAPSSDEVTIRNQLPTPITLSFIDPHVVGLSIKLDRASVNSGDKAVVRFESDGNIKPRPQPIKINVRVRQTNQLIPIMVSIGEAPKQ